MAKSFALLSFDEDVWTRNAEFKQSSAEMLEEIAWYFDLLCLSSTCRHARYLCRWEVLLGGLSRRADNFTYALRKDGFGCLEIPSKCNMTVLAVYVDRMRIAQKFLPLGNDDGWMLNLPLINTLRPAMRTRWSDEEEVCLLIPPGSVIAEEAQVGWNMAGTRTDERFLSPRSLKRYRFALSVLLTFQVPACETRVIEECFVDEETVPTRMQFWNFIFELYGDSAYAGDDRNPISSFPRLKNFLACCTEMMPIAQRVHIWKLIKDSALV
jgi:hypothetical protein